jgi:hypothetical protein
MLLGSIVCQPCIGEYAAYLALDDGLDPVFQAVAPLIEEIAQLLFGDTENVRPGDFIPDGGAWAPGPREAGRRTPGRVLSQTEAQACSCSYPVRAEEMPVFSIAQTLA